MTRKVLSVATRMKRDKLRNALKCKRKRMKRSLLRASNQWQDILGNKKLIVLLHKVELPIKKEDKDVAKHDESLDYEIEEEDVSLQERLQGIESADIISKENFKTHDNSIDNTFKKEKKEIPVTKVPHRVELPDAKTDERLAPNVDSIDNEIKKEDRLQNSIEESESVKVKIEPKSFDLASTSKNHKKRELRVSLIDIGKELETKEYVHNLVRSRETSGLSRKKEFNSLSHYPSVNDSSRTSVHSSVSQTSTKDACDTTIDMNNTSRVDFEGDDEQKSAYRTIENEEKCLEKKKRGRKPESMENVPDEANRSVKNDDLNVSSLSSKHKSVQQADIKISPKKDIAKHVVPNILKNAVRNINTSSTSNVSSTFNFTDDWKPEFKNTQSFGVEKLVTEVRCDNEKLNDTAPKAHGKGERTDKVLEVVKIATPSEITINNTPSKSKPPQTNKSVKTVRLRNSVALIGNPFFMKVVNEDNNEKKTWARRKYVPNTHDKAKELSFDKVMNAVEVWNNNDANFKKTIKRSPKPSLADQPTREYKTNERNDHQKSVGESLAKSPDDFPTSPLRKNTEAVPKEMTLDISDTATCTSSQSSEKSELGDVESLSDGSKIIGGDNKTVVNRKRKFKDHSSLATTDRNSSKKLKLDRWSWQNNRIDLSERTRTSNSVSPGSTHLLTPLHDASSSTEVSRKVFNYNAKRHRGNEFGRPALINSSLDSEESKSPEVQRVTHGSIESRLEKRPTGYNPAVERQRTTDKSLCSKEESTREDDIKNSPKKEKSTPNVNRSVISDVQTTVDKSKDSKIKLNAEANTRTRCSVKSRLGPRVDSKKLEFNATGKTKEMVSPSAKSRLDSSCISLSRKSITSEITSSTDSSPANMERSKSSSLCSPCLTNEKLKDFNKNMQNYKIPKICQGSINKSLLSNSQHSATSEVCNSNATIENIEDEDYICLHPDESFSDFEEELNDSESKKTYSQTAESFAMTDSVFDRFVTKNQSEFDVQYENSKDVNSQNDIFEKGKTVESLEIKPLLNNNIASSTYSSPSDNKSVVESIKNKIAERYFHGSCFHYLRWGNCRMLPTCKYNHDESILITKILSASWTFFQNLITHMLEHNYINLTKMVVKEKVYQIEASEIISLLRMLYNLKPQCFRNKDFISVAVDALKRHQVPLKEIVSKFLAFIPDDVSKRNLFYAIKECTPNGALWDTTKDLVLSIRDLTTTIVCDIMLECVKSRPENAEDVNVCVVSSLAPLFRATIRHDIQASFKSLLEESVQIEESTQRHNNATLPMSSQSNEVPIISHGVSSQDQIKLDNCLQDCNNVTSASSPVRTNTQSVFTQSNISYMNDDNNNLNVDSSKSFVVEQIDNLPAAKSIFRDRFRQFFGSLNTLRQALSQQNYKFAIQILDHARNSETDNTFYTLSCYRILCQEVKLSAHHMNKIRMLTVQMNIDLAFRKSLADITKFILIRLADEGLYMLAYSLLENWKEFMDCNASLTLLMAEIYLGSDQPLEALNVLKRHNIIHSNRCKWTLPCDAKDEYYRAKLLPILLNSLSITNPDYALHLFEFLAHIQSSNFHPIDLTRCIDPLVSSFLLTGDMELIVRAGRLIFAYNVPLAPITHRALIATTISEDVLLARQLYRNAMSRGIYSSAKFQPTTHLILDPHCSFEEVYLALFEFLQDLLANIGPALERLKFTDIRAYIFVESIRSHEPTASEETVQPAHAYKRLLAFRSVVRQVLETRFEPPITLVRRASDKILKIRPKSLINYLKAGHL